MPRSQAAARIDCISERDGAMPLSHLDTVACVTPAMAANSACVTENTFFRMFFIAFMTRILCANG